MISIRSFNDAERALASPLDTAIADFLRLRIEQLASCEIDDLDEVAHIIIAEAGDSLATIEGEAGAGGAALSRNFVDGTRLGESGFTDNFEFVQRHDGFFEAVIILTDTFGVLLVVPDRPGVDLALLGLMHDHP